MTRALHSLVLISTVVFLALATAQGEPAVALATGILVVVTASAVGARHAAIAIRALEITIGARGRAHRQQLNAQVAPQHPSTPGRPRTRAPSFGLLAA